MKKFGMMRRILSLFLGAVSFSSQGAYADKKRRDAGTKLTRTSKVKRNKDGVIEAIRDAKKKGHNIKLKKLRNGKLKVTIRDKEDNITTYAVKGFMVLAVLGLFGAYWKYHKSEEDKEEQSSGDQKGKKHEKKDEVDETKKKTENEENKTELEDKEGENEDQEDNKDKEEEDNKELEDKDNLQEEIDKSEKCALEQDGPREDMSNFIYNAFSEDSKKNTASVMINFNYEFCYSNNGIKVGDHVIKKAKPFMPVLLSDKYFDRHITVKDFEVVDGYKRFCIDEIQFGYYGMNSGMFKLSPGGVSYTGEMCKLSEDDLKKYSVSDIAFAMICNVLHGDLEYARRQIYNNNGNLKDGFREIDYSGYFLNEEAGNMKEPNFRLLLLESKVYLLKRKIGMLRGSSGSNGRVSELENKLKSAKADLDSARKHALELVKKKKEMAEESKKYNEDDKNIGVEINSDDDSDYEV